MEKKAFDGVVNSSNNPWHSSETCHASYTIRDQYIGFTFPYPVTILKYRIWPRYYSDHGHVNNWRPRACDYTEQIVRRIIKMVNV